MLKRISLVTGVVACLAAGSALADWDSNPGFEETPLLTGWSAYTITNATTVSVSMDYALPSGSNSLKFATENIANAEIEDFPINDPMFRYTVVDNGGIPGTGHNAAVPNTEYTASAYYYLDTALLNDFENILVGIFWYKVVGGAWLTSSIDLGGYTGLEPRSVELEKVGEWTQISHTGIAPADAQFMAVALEVVGDGSTVYFDGVSVIPEPASLLLVGMGLGVFALVRRKRAQRE